MVVDVCVFVCVCSDGAGPTCGGEGVVKRAKFAMRVIVLFRGIHFR